MTVTGASMLDILQRAADGFPDPMLPVPQPQTQMPCINQRRRRSEILAITRQLLDREGYAGVGVRAVAEHSKVSIQTVYNLVGKRTTLLAEAVTEHIGMQGRAALTRSGYPNPVIALSDTYWQGTALYPRYTRQATLTYFPPDRPLFEQINRRGLQLIRDGFRQMHARGVLRASDAGALASRIASMTSILVLNGLTCEDDLLDLRRELVASTALLLMGAVTPAHGAEIDRWLHTFEAVWATANATRPN